MPQSQNTDQLPAKSGRDTESQDQTFTDRSKAVLLLWILNVFFSVVCLLCLCARLFICALWSPAGKGLTSWLLFSVSKCEFVTFPLVF